MDMILFFTLFIAVAGIIIIFFFSFVVLINYFLDLEHLLSYHFLSNLQTHKERGLLGPHMSVDSLHQWPNL